MAVQPVDRAAKGAQRLEAGRAVEEAAIVDGHARLGPRQQLTVQPGVAGHAQPTLAAAAAGARRSGSGSAGGASSGQQHAERPRHPARLVQRLLVLGLDDGVVHDRAADVRVGATAGDGDGADRDVQVAAAVRGEVADRPRVDPAHRRLQLVDDLERADLRRAADRTARQHRAQRRVEAHAAPPARRHRRGQVMHVRVRLQLRELRHGHAARLRDPPEVVAFEVDDHHVLRGVLGARAQLGGQAGVLDGVATARARALDRPRLQPVAVDQQQPLRRRRQHLDASVRPGGRIEVGGEWRRAGAPQPPVGLEAGHRQRCAEALREVDLVDVAGGDVAPRRLGALQVLVTLHVRLEAREAPRRRFAFGRRAGILDALELPAQRGDGLGLAAEPAALLDPVPGERGVVPAEREVGRADVVDRGRGQAFNVPGQLESEVADRAPREREPRRRGGSRSGGFPLALTRLDRLRDDGDRIALEVLDAVSRAAADAATARAERPARLRGENRPASALRVRERRVEPGQPRQTTQGHCGALRRVALRRRRPRLDRPASLPHGVALPYPPGMQRLYDRARRETPARRERPAR